MSGPHLASTNEAIERAQARQLEQAERHLRECVDALVSRPPLVTCPKCNATGHAFVCSERGCPVNGGAAYGPAITHAEGSPLLHSQDDFGQRHAARLVPRQSMLDGRGDAAPRNPEDQGDGA